MNIERNSFSMLKIDNFVYVIGGFNKNKFLNKCEWYDLNKK